jgi:hypothetical protein
LDLDLESVDLLAIRKSLSKIITLEDETLQAKLIGCQQLLNSYHVVGRRATEEYKKF